MDRHDRITAAIGITGTGMLASSSALAAVVLLLVAGWWRYRVAVLREQRLRDDDRHRHGLDTQLTAQVLHADDPDRRRSALDAFTVHRSSFASAPPPNPSSDAVEPQPGATSAPCRTTT